MTHKCHDLCCKRSRSGILFPTVGRPVLDIHMDDYTGVGLNDINDEKEYIKEQARKMAKFCFSNVLSCIHERIQKGI